jgi:archaellum component FlaC
MDNRFFDTFKKTLTDAKKMGVADDNTAVLITTFLNNINKQIADKSNEIERLRGEIVSLKKMFDLWNVTINNRIVVEKRLSEQFAEQAKETEPVKSEPKKRTRKKKA